MSNEQQVKNLIANYTEIANAVRDCYNATLDNLEKLKQLEMTFADAKVWDKSPANDILWADFDKEWPDPKKKSRHMFIKCVTGQMKHTVKLLEDYIVRHDNSPFSLCTNKMIEESRQRTKDKKLNQQFRSQQSSQPIMNPQSYMNPQPIMNPQPYMNPQPIMNPQPNMNPFISQPIMNPFISQPIMNPQPIINPLISQPIINPLISQPIMNSPQLLASNKQKQSRSNKQKSNAKQSQDKFNNTSILNNQLLFPAPQQLMPNNQQLGGQFDAQRLDGQFDGRQSYN